MRMVLPGMKNAALPAPRAGQDRFGAAREERARQDRAKEGVGAPGSNFGAPGSKVGAPFKFLPCPRQGQGNDPSFMSWVRSWELANTPLFLLISWHASVC